MPMKNLPPITISTLVAAAISAQLITEGTIASFTAFSLPNLSIISPEKMLANGTTMTNMEAEKRNEIITVLVIAAGSFLYQEIIFWQCFNIKQPNDDMRPKS